MFILGTLPDGIEQPYPEGWEQFDHPLIGPGCYRRPFFEKGRRLVLTVIWSASVEKDGKRWVHVSVSRSDQTLPRWKELQKVKDDFIGRDNLALQILPPENEHYSIGEILHLWHCVDGRPVPDFRKAGQI